MASHRILYFAFFAASFVLGSRAAIGRSDAVGACEVSYAHAREIGRQVVEADPSTVFIDYGEDDATKLLIAINASPPPPDWTAEHILTVDIPDEPIIVALIHDGCITQSFREDRDEWAKIRRAAIGDQS